MHHARGHSANKPTSTRAASSFRDHVKCQCLQCSAVLEPQYTFTCIQVRVLFEESNERVSRGDGHLRHGMYLMAFEYVEFVGFRVKGLHYRT